MSKLFNFLKENKYLLLVVAVSFLTFFRMLKFGMFSTQDFHLFRLFEFDKCVKSLELPCRWAPDAGLGYGEPLFNFYGQFAYAIGEVFYILGFGLINSTKITFSISLLGSAVAMYFLSKRVWKSDIAGALSALLYVFAPYRAVDVWVRGALPEALSFLLIPLIVLSLEKYIEENTSRNFALLTLTTTMLVITHNLSVVMFGPFLVGWAFLRILTLKKPKRTRGLALSAVFSIGLAAFYLLPLLFESTFVNLRSTTQGYFDFHNHFATLRQLFISNYWGYGASNWGDGDGLSMAVGYVQWILGALVVFVMVWRRKIDLKVAFLSTMVLGFLFLTHNKSTFVWENLDFMSYIQFPWRFLGPIVFCLSLMAGYLVDLLKKYKSILIVIPVLVVVLNFGFFREDIWYKVNDSYYLTEPEWLRQRSASIGDFWPIYGPIPTSPPEVNTQYPKSGLTKSNYRVFNNIKINKAPEEVSDILLPVTFFPGWHAKVDGGIANVKPDQNSGMISLPVSQKVQKIELWFSDTPIRRAGNIISTAFLLLVVLIWIKKPFYFWRQ